MRAPDAAPVGAPFDVRTVVALVMAGVFAFAAFVVLTTYAPELRSGRDGRAHALSRSAVGFAALVRLAGDTGIPVEIDRGRGGSGGDGLRVLTPEPGGDAKAIADTIAAKQEGVTLVVLPKWRVGPVVGRSGWVSRIGLLDSRETTAMFHKAQQLPVTRRPGASRPRLVDVQDPGSGDVPSRIGKIDSLQVFAPSDRYETLVSDGQGNGVLVRMRGDAGLFVLSDPDLFNTQGLSDLARARMALRILEVLRGGGPVVFDLSINGFRASPSLLKLALEPPFLAATLCAIAAAALMGWHAAARFGAPRRTGRALALGKTALADNSAALLRLAKREHRMAGPYAQLTIEAAARAVGAPRGLDQAQTVALLDRLSAKADMPPPSRLLAEAERVKDPAGLVRLARRLHDWRVLMTRQRR